MGKMYYISDLVSRGVTAAKRTYTSLNVWQCMAMYSNVRQCIAMYDNIWQYITMYGNIWQSVILPITICYILGQSGIIITCTIIVRKEGKRSAYIDI